MENYKIDIEMSFTPPNPVARETCCKVCKPCNEYSGWFLDFTCCKRSYCIQLVYNLTPASSNNVDDLFIIINFYLLVSTQVTYNS